MKKFIIIGLALMTLSACEKEEVPVSGGCSENRIAKKYKEIWVWPWQSIYTEINLHIDEGWELYGALQGSKKLQLMVFCVDKEVRNGYQRIYG